MAAVRWGRERWARVRWAGAPPGAAFQIAQLESFKAGGVLLTGNYREGGAVRAESYAAGALPVESFAAGALRAESYRETHDNTVEDD